MSVSFALSRVKGCWYPARIDIKGLFLRYVALRAGPPTVAAAAVYDSLIELIVISTGLLLKVRGSPIAIRYCHTDDAMAICITMRLLHNNG